MTESIQDPIWKYPKKNKKAVEKIIQDFSVHPVIAEVLVARGISDSAEVHKFLYSKLPNLHSPDLFNEIDKAVKRISSAYKNQEPVLIYGDNDVDGITGVALLVEFLQYVGCNVQYLLSSKSSLKSGVLEEAINFAKEHKISLIITVDCGITATEDVKRASKENIDIIITDHHQPLKEIPQCLAILNPKVPGNPYPNKDITGVGVAFKLAHAYTNFLVQAGAVEANFIDLKRYLDLVALGTIADMGVLLDENRILVRYGLVVMQNGRRIGLSKLIKSCNVKVQELTTIDVPTKIAPRLNSLGRISDPLKGVELLLTKDHALADKLTKELEANNIERQKIEKKDYESIISVMKTDSSLLKNKALVITSPTIHQGVIPILAARIAKLYTRPTVIFAKGEKLAKGSIRTIPSFPVIEVLKELSDLLVNYGGHDYAAGLTIENENIETFSKEFIKRANASLKSNDITPSINLDAKISFKDITFEFLESLELLEPYGTGNPPPLLYCEAKQVWPPKVIARNHLKLFLEENNRFLEGIAFGLGRKKSKLSNKNLKLHLAFTPITNNYLNKASIQLNIREFEII